MRPTLDDLRVLEAVHRTPAAKHRRKTIDVMHRRHGHGDGECRACRQLVHVPAGRLMVYKCRHFGATASGASDWRLSWPACGAKEPISA
jgi:hypothetical protein